MGDEPEVIRQQMEETRAQLTEKFEQLENQVAGVVQSASSAVNETVEAVQGAVGGVAETVQSVGNVFDLRRQVEAHPLIAFGGAVAAGFLAAHYLHAPRSRTQQPLGQAAMSLPPAPPSFATSLVSSGWSELTQLAFAGLKGLVREISARAVPQLLETVFAPPREHREPEPHAQPPAPQAPGDVLAFKKAPG